MDKARSWSTKVEVFASLKSNEKNTSETSLASGKFPSMKFISALPPPALSCKIYKLKYPLTVDTESMNRKCMLSVHEIRKVSTRKLFHGLSRLMTNDLIEHTTRNSQLQPAPPVVPCAPRTSNAPRTFHAHI